MLKLAAALLAVGLVPSVASADHHEKADIVDTAVEAGQFETLVTAVKAAGLVETLKGEGPFTVFAPTDEAFAALPEGTVEELLKPENKEKLTAVLTYHVVAGKVDSSAAIEAGEAETLEGGSVTIKKTDDGVMVNDATVVKADIMTSNGVIHVIDAVLMPPKDSEKTQATMPTSAAAPTSQCQTK